MPTGKIPHHFAVALAWCAGCIFGGTISNVSHGFVALGIGIVGFFWCQRYVRIAMEMEETLGNSSESHQGRVRTQDEVIADALDVLKRMK